LLTTKIVNFQVNDEESPDEDIWDDTALIEAYDRAVSLAKEEVQRRMGLSTPDATNVTSSAQESRRHFGKKENKKKSQQQKNRNVAVLSSNGDQVITVI
jgi:survival motor neuron protein